MKVSEGVSGVQGEWEDVKKCVLNRNENRTCILLLLNRSDLSGKEFFNELREVERKAV